MGKTAAPSDTFQTRDGWLLVSVVGNPLFERWARLMGETHWLTDPRFATDEGRGEHGEMISERMARWCAERTTAQAIAALEAARLPCGEVSVAAAALDNEHVRAARLLASVDFPGLASNRRPLRSRRSACRRPRRAFAIARRCSANTPMRFSRNSVTTIATIARLRAERVI